MIGGQNNMMLGQNSIPNNSMLYNNQILYGNMNMSNINPNQTLRGNSQINIPLQTTQVNDPIRINPVASSQIVDKEQELTKIYELQKEEELRIEIGKSETLKITIESGSAEIEGAELPLNYPMEFSYNKFSIFCWTEAKIRVQGNIQNIYTSYSNQGTMIQYLMAHHLINEKRNEALVNNKIGPVVLVTGSNQSGKRTLCHIFLNYALKLGWTPIYVDLDLNNEISVTGTLAATPVDFVVPNEFMIDSSIMLFHGNSMNDINIFLYEKQINEIATIIKSKLEYNLDLFKKKFNLREMHSNNLNLDSLFVNPEHPTQFASGVIIHCPMIEASKDNQIYKTFIEQFQADMVFVIENEKLFNVVKNLNSSITSNEKSSKATVCLLQKTQGINTETTYKDYLEQRRFDSYFKGPFNNIKINEFVIDLTQYKLLKIIFSNVTSALLPIGSTSDLNIILKEVNHLEENLLNRIVAIPHLDEKITNDLEKNYDRKLNSYVEQFARAPVSFLAYM
jgi:polyribonucleotide 5'-hydroxyl-kinase